MKKIIFILITAGFFVFAGSAFAQMGMMGNYWQNSANVPAQQSVEINGVLQDIYNTQNITSQAQVDCSKVIDDQFEKLGDAYMGVMLPNKQQHEAMDNMMGGEGSASLRQAHINMGRSYLGCWSNYNSGPIMMPMMGGMMGGSGMMGGFGGMIGNNGFGRGMMGGYYNGGLWFGWITMILVWILIIVGIIALIRWMSKK